MERQTFPSVWDAIEDSPGEAAAMRLRSELMVAVQEALGTWELPRAETARRLGLEQSLLDDLLRGRISRFSLDALVGIATRAGLIVKVDIQGP